MPAVAIERFVEEPTYGTNPKHVELNVRGHAGSCNVRKFATQVFPAGLGRLPSASIPIFVRHSAARADPKNIKSHVKNECVEAGNRWPSDSPAQRLPDPGRLP